MYEELGFARALPIEMNWIGDLWTIIGVHPVSFRGFGIVVHRSRGLLSGLTGKLVFRISFTWLIWWWIEIMHIKNHLFKIHWIYFTYIWHFAILFLLLGFKFSLFVFVSYACQIFLVGPRKLVLGMVS